MGRGGREERGINTCKISLQTKGKKTLRIQRKVPEYVCVCVCVCVCICPSVCLNEMGDKISVTLI